MSTPRMNRELEGRHCGATDGPEAVGERASQSVVVARREPAHSGASAVS